MQLVDRGRVNVKDVASEIGVTPDSLSASLAVMLSNKFLYVFFLVFKDGCWYLIQYCFVFFYTNGLNLFCRKITWFLMCYAK